MRQCTYPEAVDPDAALYAPAIRLAMLAVAGLIGAGFDWGLVVLLRGL